ncbi:hypothetical protein RN001_005260 [Aquatica leii]|uniref:Acyl-coenzyme A thioesterase 13 n=1 Tax=Aquatica leii TaxID=1421715 RepID=A0AAN7SAH4_9COLE|nr:hypothetical protein RN001_005260 [Aquatica leii]
MLSLYRVFKRCMGTNEIRNFLKNSAVGFDKVLQKVNIIEAEKGICVAELLIEEEHTNPMRGLHGGLMATIVDSLTSYALFTHEKVQGIPSVSVDLNMTYTKSVGIGEVIQIKAETIKAGYTLGFAECTITNKTSGEVLAKGTHTKYIFRADR